MSAVAKRQSPQHPPAPQTNPRSHQKPDETSPAMAPPHALTRAFAQHQPADPLSTIPTQLHPSPRLAPPQSTASSLRTPPPNKQNPRPAAAPSQESAPTHKPASRASTPRQ